MRPRHHSSSQPQLQIGRAAFFIAPGTLNLWNLCSRELKEHKKKDYPPHTVVVGGARGQGVLHRSGRQRCRSSPEAASRS
jgi:hypothetical protein